MASEKYFETITLYADDGEEVSVNALVDTGSSSSLISSRLLNYLGLMPEYGENIKIKDLSGDRVSANPVSIAFKFRGVSGSNTFYSVKGLKSIIGFNVLVGIDLIKKIMKNKGGFTLYANNFKQIKEPIETFKLERFKGKAKAAGAAIKKTSSAIGKAAIKKMGESKGILANLGTLSGNRYEKTFTLPASADEYEAANMIRNAIKSELMADAKERLELLNPFKKETNRKKYNNLIPRFMGEFEPKIIGKMISFKLLPERSYFTKKMIDIMQAVHLSQNFLRVSRRRSMRSPG